MLNETNIEGESNLTARFVGNKKLSDSGFRYVQNVVYEHEG